MHQYYASTCHKTAVQTSLNSGEVNMILAFVILEIDLNI
jgi:hypothetical protein